MAASHTTLKTCGKIINECQEKYFKIQRRYSLSRARSLGSSDSESCEWNIVFAERMNIKTLVQGTFISLLQYALKILSFFFLHCSTYQWVLEYSMFYVLFYVDWYLRSVLNLNFANTTQLKQSNPCLRDVKTFLHRFKTNWNSYTNSLHSKLRGCWYFKVFQRPLDSHECRGQL